MCMLKSGLLFKAGVFVPDYDSHDQMLREKGIEDTAENRIAGKYIRFELSPADDDPFSPVESWVFCIDQDELPAWYLQDPEKYEQLARKSVEEWAARRIFVGAQHLEIASGSGYRLKDCSVDCIKGDAEICELRGSSTVQNICGSSTVKHMWESATVQYMRDSSTVQNMYGHAVAINREKGVIYTAQNFAFEVKQHGTAS